MDNPTSLSGLSATLAEQFGDWVDRRKPQEEKLLRAYQDNMRISTDFDTKGTGIAKSQKSRVFIGSTRSKIRTARAKIKDVMFGNGEMPFDTKPSNDDLKQFSDVVEEIITYQLKEARYKKTLEQGTDTLCTFGTGFIFGPLVRNDSYSTIEQDEKGLSEKEYDYPCPYFEHGRTIDCYPDPEAEEIDQGMGIYWAARKSKDFIRELKDKPGYNNEAIDRALQQTLVGTSDEGSDRLEQVRANLYRYTKEGRVWFLRYFGKVKKSELTHWKNDSGANSSDETMVEAIIQMAGGYVIKAEENSYKNKRRPVTRCVYEDVEHEMWGVGVAENNDPNQRVINAAFRLYLEGKAMALMKTYSADRSKFETSEDFKIFPGKRFDMKPQLTPDERKTAIIWHDVQDVTAGWEKVIELSESFSDDDTGITKYTQGNDSQHLNKTATGISMIMSASSMPLKEVIGNIDEMWIEQHIESLIEWDFDYLEPEVVKKFLGDKQAALWTQIKQYGKSNFMEWFATGTSTFMAKEVLMNKLNGFLQVVAGNEHLSSLTDMRELLQQVWDAGQIGKESPIYTEDEIKQNQSNPMQQQAQQEIQKIQQQAQQAVQQAQQETAQAKQDAKDAQQQAQIKMMEIQGRANDAAAKERMHLMEMLHKTANSSVANEQAMAAIDLTQAQTLKTLVDAHATASQPLIDEATNLEEGEDGKKENIGNNDTTISDSANLAADDSGATEPATNVAGKAGGNE